LDHDVVGRRDRERLPREVRVLLVGTLVNRAGAFVQPFLVLYLTLARGFTPAQAGAMVAVTGLGGLFSQLLGGWSADRFGRRVTLATGLFLAGLSLAALGAARGTAEIAACAFLAGLFGDTYRPAAQALIADVLPPERRPVAFGLMFWALNLGFSIAALTAGVLAERSWGLLFAIDALTCMAYAAVVLVGIRHDPPRVRHVGAGPAPGFGSALRDATFMLMVGLTVLQAVAYFQAFLVMPLAMVGAGLSPSAYGIAAATNGLVIIALQPFVTRRTAHLDANRTLAASLLLCGAGFWTMRFAVTTAAFVVCTVIWTLGEIGQAGLLPSIVSDLADPTARGRYLGVFGSAFGLAALVSPLVGPSLFQAAGAPAVWTLCLVLFAVAAGGNLLLRPTVVRRRAAHRAATAAG
jgi:MFS family permease